MKQPIFKKPELAGSPTTDANALADGEALFRRPWTFLKSAPALEFLPDADRAEIAFAGRSNVGKSSLINAIIGQGSLARTSNTPGRTQELNFYICEDAPLYLVDMPGYGYAQAPKPLVEAWQKLVRSYLRGRPTLKRTFCLIDSRHGVKPIDDETFAMLDDAGVAFQVVLTKIDKLKTAEAEEVFERTVADIKKHPAALPLPLATSSEKRIGLEALRAEISSLIEA
jgi:GTP-binding protein